MKSLFIVSTFILSLMFFSCDKIVKCENSIKLTDENTSILKGKWKWIYSERRKDYGTGSQLIDTVFYANNHDEYLLEFTNDGVLIMRINEELYNSFCIFDSQVVPTTSNPEYIHMNLFLNNDDEESSLTYLYKKTSDTILLTIKDTEFPYSYEINDDEQIFYKNYFQKQ